MKLSDLPVLPKHRPSPADWLVRPVAAKAAGYRSADGKDLILDNGLISRTFRLSPNAACIAFDNLRIGDALLRAVKPEAMLTLNGTEYAVGGLIGQPNRAYLRREWLAKMAAAPGAFRFDGFALGRTAVRFPWKPTGGVRALWPPPGVSLALRFVSPPPGRKSGVSSVSVVVHYELYDNLPLISKWFSVTNNGPKSVRLNSFTVELLAAAEPESVVDVPEQWMVPNLTVLSDYSFGGMALNNARGSAQWMPDPEYDSQVNYARQTPCLLMVRPSVGPAIDLVPGESMQSFCVFELVHDSDCRERKGLAVRRACRAIAPWCLDSPLMLHVNSSDPRAVRLAIDQCAEVGFEMVNISFNTGFNIEDVSPANVAKFKALADHARARGIRLGGYSMLASRRISDEHDVINPKTGKPGGTIFGNSPCLCSKWGREYFEHIERFLIETGLEMLEHDGSYPGDVCASTKHPDHREAGDSQWRQFQRIAAFYRRCRERGIFLHVPDWYFLQGSCKTPIGYREVNFTLPLAEQHVHCRQNLYDGTWDKTPTMGSGFVPLASVHGGKQKAFIEPLGRHLPDYERYLTNHLGYGVQACYRGPRLFDTRATRTMVRKWVCWFKSHRAILESDIIHLRRPNGRDWDGVLHINPSLPTKGMAVLYNPLDRTITSTIVLPLYYTGLTKTAKVRINDKGSAKIARLDRDYNVRLRVKIPAQGLTWVTIS